MMEFIEHLRKKPQHVRARFAFGGALILTSLVALIWSTTLPARLQTISGTLQEESAVQTGSVGTSFDALLQNMGEGLEDTMEKNEQPEQTLDEPAPSENLGNSMNTMGTWKSPDQLPESEGATTSEEKVAKEPPQTPPEAKVILIGTTTKKTE